MLKNISDKISIDRYSLIVPGLLLLVVILVMITRGKSVEEQYPGKKVLRVAFEMRLPEVARVWDEVKANFEEIHPDVLIVRVEDINKRLLILEAAKMLPDIMTPNTFFLYRYRHALMPLDELIERDKNEINIDDFYPTLLNTCKYNNQQLTIPYFFNTSLLYYNIDMFNDAGVPLPTNNWTYDDYVSSARMLEKYDENGNQVQWGTSIVSHWWVEWLTHVHKAGGDFIGDDWKHCPMDSPESIEGLRFFNDIVNTYKVSPKQRNLNTFPFLSQQAAMEFTGHTANWIGLRSTAKFKWDVALLPRSPNNKKGGERVSVGLGINKDCEYKELAWTFIKYLTNCENRAKFVNAGAVPVRRSVTNEVFFKRGPDGRYLVDPQHKEVLFEALDQCKEQSQLPEFFYLAQTEALPHINSMLREEISPEECGKIIAKNVTNFLKMIDRKNPKFDYEKGCLREF